MAALDDEAAFVEGTAVEVDMAEADLESSPPGSQSESPAVLFLLDKLNSATPSRKRKPPPVGKKRSSGNTLKDPKVHPSQRLKEFPNEGLCVSDVGKLFCNACKEILSVKKSTLSSHLKSTKHVESRAKLKSEQPQQVDIITALRECDESKWLPSGDVGSLDDQKVYQLKVLTAFLNAGVPISKVKYFRDFLEESALQLTEQMYLSDLLPYIIKKEIVRIKEEINGRYLSIVFDTSEALAVVIRYVKEWGIHQCLVQMEFLPKWLSGEEIAHRIISTLSVSFGVESNFLLAAISDGGSEHNAAARMLKGAYPQAMEVCCFSYTLNAVGNKFNTPVLTNFISRWVSLFSQIPTKMLWKSQTGTAVALYAKGQWWNEWEIINQMMVQFDDIEPFLTTNTDICSSLRPELLDILHNTPGVCQLKMELAAVFDIGKHFVKAIQNIDSDGALMVNCYEEIVKLRAVLNTGYHPNIQSVAQSLAPGNIIAQQQWTSYAMSCVQPGLDFFKAEFGDDTKAPLCAFKAMRYFAPARIFEIQPSASDLDSLTIIPFLNSPPVITGLKEELAAYLARATDVSVTTDVADWWRKNSELLPNWSDAAKKALLMQPSCAALEKTFLLFSEYEQDSVPEDYVEASIILRFNEQ